MLVFTHPACLQHDPGRGHPECPERLQVVLDALRRAWPQGLDWREAPAAKRGDLARVHDSELIDQVLLPQTEPLRLLDMDTITSPGSAAAALHAAGAGVAAVDAVMLGDDPVAFCAVRPPGHHATASTAMGFCLFNNIAVAAAHARDRYGLERIAVVDFDVHHGNGTQALLWDEARVLFVSSQQFPLWPGTGAASERGAHGQVVNLPLPPGSDGALALSEWQGALDRMREFSPQLVLISAGFDAHRDDPLAQLEWDDDDYAALTRAILDAAGKAPVVSCLEGGYDLRALGRSVRAHVDVLMEAD